MNLATLLSLELTFCNVESDSKLQLMREASELIASRMQELTAAEIFDALLAREQLGSTGLGDGIAIPHCRIPRCQKTIGCLIKLRQSVDFEAIDGEPVDLLCFLLVPESTLEGHLQVLGMLAEHFTDAAFRARLRAAQTDAALYHAAIADA
jgi:PTS system nitrogen regulatory IIA component